MAIGSRNPDELLAAEQFPDMNRLFYSTRPWMYFAKRWELLLLAAGAQDELIEIGRKGVRAGGLTATLDPDGTPHASADHERFVAAEAQVLLHHVSETLLRLYLAHEGRPPCPWLEVARIRSPKRFKQMVERRFLTELPTVQRRRHVGEVFFGAADHSAITPSIEEADWNANVDNIEAFLDHYTRLFLDSGLYNALKHGLAVRPGQEAMSLGTPGAGSFISMEGPAIAYLSLAENSEGELHWWETTQWVDTDRAMVFAWTALQMIASIWDLARWRYLGDKPESVRRWTEPDYGELMSRLTGDWPAVKTDRMNVELAYYRAPNRS